MKKTDQDVLDLENLKHPAYASGAEKQQDQSEPLEKQLSAAADHLDHEEAPRMVGNDMLKAVINDGTHFENGSSNVNLHSNSNRAQPKVSLCFQSKFMFEGKKL